MSAKKKCRSYEGNQVTLLTEVEDIADSVCFKFLTEEKGEVDSVYTDTDTASTMKNLFWTGQSDNFMKKIEQHQELLEFRKDCDSGLRYLAKICATDMANGFTTVLTMVQVYNKVSYNLVDFWFVSTYDTNKLGGVLACVREYKQRVFKSIEYEAKRDLWLSVKKSDYMDLFKHSRTGI